MGYHHDDHDDGEQDPFIEEVLREIYMDQFEPPEPEASEPEPEPAEDLASEEPVPDTTVTPPPAPVAPLSASAEAAAHRRVEAERKRVEREERRAAGLPDRRTVDTVVSAALGEVLRQANAGARIRARGSARGMVIDGEAVLRAAIRGLRARGCSKEAASRAVAERLLGREAPGAALASG
ncbi:hypothetical protein SAMN04487844_107124 [Methylobacterium sp. yr596]|nr:hypothetical protein SAMN04487844_107124 [Methylobacterium sp. yr596]